MNGKFAPPTGRALLILGQDVASVDAYMASVHTAPGGVAAYTSLKELEGLAEVADAGAGPQYLDYLADKYRNSTLSVGLSLVDYLDAINNSEADAQIDTLLDTLAAYNRPVFLRFGDEFDSAANHYDPAVFVAAWQYFYARMETKGVTNVALVWQSAALCAGTFDGHPLEAWYPGDAYVDWVGLSYFA